jgi:methylenetetrahydrofolate reductase (NADPH)
LSPDFISVTAGAGGRENSEATIDIASDIKNGYGVESVVHLPGIGLRKPDVSDILEELQLRGIENILALRGDFPEGRTLRKGDFDFASDLIGFINEAAPGKFNIVAACYPEGHSEAPDRGTDMRNLKRKVERGVDQLITQVFFDNGYFYDFLERAAAAGIDVPVEAGIMPLTDLRQIERIVPLCGAALPPKLIAMIDRHGSDPAAMRDAGIAYALEQIVDLIDRGADGIHLYMLNDVDTAQRIHETAAPLLRSE